jgi:hypothetical protein
MVQSYYESSMDRMHYPFWVVTRRNGADFIPLSLQSCPNHVVAFTSSQKALEYTASLSGDWEFQMVGRPTFLPMIEHFQQQGFVGICLDPDEEANATIDFAEFHEPV